jgi:tRNA modification GTPase
MERSETMLARTKADLAPAATGELAVSVVTGAGLDELRRTAAERIFGGRVTLGDLEPALTRERHRTALSRARSALAEAMPQLAPDGDAVLAAHHVREATTALEELLGAIDVEEVLERVFGRFCVGK